MAKYSFVKDGVEFDYATRTVEVEKTIVVKAKKSLWKGVGDRLSIAELAELGVQVKFVPDQTPERIEFEHIVKLYAANPDFATRVAEWKAKYDTLGVAYDAKTEDIEEAIYATFSDKTEAVEFLSKFNADRTNVMVNYQAAERAISAVEGIEYDPVDDYTTWTTFPVLVKWLPGSYEEKDIPVFKETEIIASDEREAEIVAELNA